MQNSLSSAHCLFVNQTDANMLATPIKSSSSVIHPSSLPLRPTNSTLFVDVLTLALINMTMESRLLVSRASHQKKNSEVKLVFSHSSPTLALHPWVQPMPCPGNSKTSTVNAKPSTSCQLQTINLPALSFNTSTSPQLKPLNFKTPSIINLSTQAENRLRCFDTSTCAGAGGIVCPMDSNTHW